LITSATSLTNFVKNENEKNTGLIYIGKILHVPENFTPLPNV